MNIIILIIIIYTIQTTDKTVVDSASKKKLKLYQINDFQVYYFLSVLTKVETSIIKRQHYQNFHYSISINN